MGFQDASDFNVATSSLHALSNSMALTRSDRQSPHSSPRMTRRSTTANANAQAAMSQPSNDIYASQQQQQQQQQPQQSAQQQSQPNTKHTVIFHINDNLRTSIDINCVFSSLFFHHEFSNLHQFKAKHSNHRRSHSKILVKELAIYNLRGQQRRHHHHHHRQ